MPSELKHERKTKKDHKSKKCQKIKCSGFPVCETFPATSPVIPIFGAATTTLSASIPLSFSTSVSGVAITGSCGTPVVVLLLGPIALTLCSLDETAIAAVNPLVSTLRVSGVPIIGAAPGSITSSGPVTSGVFARLVDCGSLFASGTLSQDITFTGVAAPIPAAALSPLVTTLTDEIVALTAGCAATLVTTLSAELQALIPLLFPGVTITTIGQLVAAVIADVTPEIIAFFQELLAAAATAVPVTLAVTPFGFSATISDPALRKVKSCEPLCAEATATFERTDNSPLTVIGTTSFTFSSTLSCLDLATEIPVTVATILAAIGQTTSLPSVFCATLVEGGACIPVTPAVAKTDQVTLCVDHGEACICKAKALNVF